MTSLLSQRAQQAGGQPISELMRLALAQPQLISLAAGFVDQPSLPVAATRQAITELLADPVTGHAALQYGTTSGLPPLRQMLLDRLRQADGQPACERDLHVDQVLITAGSNQLLHLVGEVLLDPGDIVLCAAPCYFVFLGMLANLGARAVGVEIDEQGMIPAALEEQLQRLDRAGERARIKFVYVNPDFENPSAVTLPAERRQQIVDIVQRWSRPTAPLYILEDAAYRELRYRGQDIPSMRACDPTGEIVISTGTFSKSYSPGIRVGWGILPKSLVTPLLEVKGNIDFGSPNFAQTVMAKVLASGLFEPHVQSLRTNYRQKLDAMLTAATDYLSSIPGVHWQIPDGGLYVWLQLPEHIDTGPQGTLLQRAMDHGVLYVPGRYAFAHEGAKPRDNCMRLSFGVQPCDKIRRGMELLAAAIRESV